ncbi:MAG TPA: hypothetical protein VK689_13420 [Armatimonadota bacterium]|nr:hypothetical protein [Armatimonadota bacterium]
MTVELTAPPAETGDESLRGRALDTLRTQILEVILGSNEPLRTVDVARMVAEELQLEFNEAEMGGLASLVRMLMDSDPLFSQSNRQWDLALRMGRAEGDRRKPVERAVEDFIDLLGKPAQAGPISVLVSSVYGREPEYYEKMIDRLVETRPQFFPVGRNRIGISRWLLEISTDDAEDVEYDNFEDSTVLDALKPIAQGVDADDAFSYARAVIEKAQAPVENRALLFLTWRQFPQTPPKDVFARLYTGNGLVAERGPRWVTAEEHERLLEAIRSLASEPEAASDLVAAAMPTEDEEIGILAPTTVRVSDEDLDQVHDYLLQGGGTYRVSELCQQALEAFPGSRTYAAVHESLLNRLREDRRFEWVGFERFRISGTIPQDVQVLPEGLSFDDGEYLGEDGAEIDKVVEPRDWKFNLDEQILHYLVQDVGDDSTTPPATRPSRLPSSPPLHHYVAGTRYLRNVDRGFFPTAPDIVEVVMVTPDGNRFEAWVNNRLGLIFGVKEWYDANLPWVGGHFDIVRPEEGDEYTLEYSGDVEPLMDIPLDRLQQLLVLRAEADTEALPLTEIVLRILRNYPEGIHFVALFTQLNVVRRTRRAQLASILSGQRFFAQSPQTPGIWSYDEKRAAKGKKKTGPKRPMREYDDEDEDLE